MTNQELVINILAGLSTQVISEVTSPETMPEHIAHHGGNALLKLEAETGKKFVSSLNAKIVLSIKTNSN